MNLDFFQLEPEPVESKAAPEPKPAPAPAAEYWKVAVPAGLLPALTYSATAELVETGRLKRGQSVIVPLGSRKLEGICLERTEKDETIKSKHILSIDDERPCLHEAFVKWLEWLSRYYVWPIGHVTEMAFPQLGRAKNARQKERKSKTLPILPDVERTQPPKLTPEQAQTIDAIQSDPGFNAHLVHGVTGSGKTEIYMRLLEKVVQEGQQGLVLVPEISLTPQLIDRFTQRLGDAVAVIHSHLTPRERTNQWWAMIEGKKQILIGARSALFCPLPKLGMIVIDEEHESSFKQDEKLKYNARDAAVTLAKFSNCPIILGSATPSLETWHNAQTGRYRYHELKLRVADRAMPEIEVVDMRNERDQRKQTGVTDLPFWMTTALHKGLVETLEKGQQSALFLNRRGVAQAVVCPDCGFVPACPNCAVKLTLHGKSHLLCHYCDYHETMTEHCTRCPDGEPKPIGLGTEMVENDLARMFPEARIARMDRDEISSREDLEQMIRAVENREVDILVGTQMIAKGLDFPGLTLVGLVMADVAFNLPDFRASERSFQLLTQVAGRSGRHLDEGAGKVIVQTYNPEHPSIKFTCEHDFKGFAEYELAFREVVGYPPYGRLASFRIQGLDEGRVKDACRRLRARAEALRSRTPQFAAVEILGPAPAPLVRLRNNYRYQLLVKGPDGGAIVTFCRHLCEKQDWVPAAVRVAVDIDAVHML